MRALNRRTLTVTLALAASAATWIALPARAHAWPTGGQFDGDPLTEGGGGGVAFTGAPRFVGHDCAVCHVDGPKTVGLHIDADPVGLFDTGYQSGKQYRISVHLTNEHAALESLGLGDNCLPTSDQRCDDNGFSFEIDDDTGHPQGSYVTATATGVCDANAVEPAAYVTNDGTAVTHSGFHHGLDTWTFCWTPPANYHGPLIMYASVLDGNGGQGTNDNPSDTVGDDVATGSVPLIEAGGSARPTQTGGCTVATGGAPRATRISVLAVLALLAGLFGFAGVGGLRGLRGLRARRK